MKKIFLCEYCIEANRIHGEKIYVGDYVNKRTINCADCDDSSMNGDVHECIILDER